MLRSSHPVAVVFRHTPQSWWDSFFPISFVTFNSSLTTEHFFSGWILVFICFAWIWHMQASASPVLTNIIEKPRKIHGGSSKRVIKILGVPSDAVSVFVRFLYSHRFVIINHESWQTFKYHHSGLVKRLFIQVFCGDFRMNSANLLLLITSKISFCLKYIQPNWTCDWFRLDLYSKRVKHKDDENY